MQLVLQNKTYDKWNRQCKTNDQIIKVRSNKESPWPALDARKLQIDISGNICLCDYVALYVGIYV